MFAERAKRRMPHRVTGHGKQELLVVDAFAGQPRRHRRAVQQRLGPRIVVYQFAEGRYRGILQRIVQASGRPPADLLGFGQAEGLCP